MCDDARSPDKVLLLSLQEEKQVRDMLRASEDSDRVVRLDVRHTSTQATTVTRTGNILSHEVLKAIAMVEEKVKSEETNADLCPRTRKQLTLSDRVYNVLDGCTDLHHENVGVQRQVRYGAVQHTSKSHDLEESSTHASSHR